MGKKKKSTRKGATKATPKRGPRAQREQSRKPPAQPALQTTRADWRPIVLAEMSKTANIMVACLKAGIDRVTFYRERNRNQQCGSCGREGREKVQSNAIKEALGSVFDCQKRPEVLTAS